MVSIIVATYNSQQTLSICLDSVLSQSTQDWECIIVDGKSKDNTLEIIKSYINLDSRFRYISEKDNGIFDALNKGVKLAKGEWIYVLGSDDKLITDGIRNLLNYSEDYDIIYGNTVDQYPNGVKRFPKSKDYHIVVKNMFCSHQALIMKRDVILKLNGFSLLYPLKADFDLVQRAYLAGYKFKQIQNTIAIFSMGGASGQASILHETERYRILKNNNSVKYPLLVSLITFSKKIIKSVYLAIFQVVKSS